jgi:cytochrome P450
VFDPSLITDILKSSEFVIPDYASGYAKLDQQSPGQGWNLVVNTLEHIPLAHEGVRHVALRRDLARLIGARSNAAKHSAAALLNRLASSVFREATRVDLIRDLVRPLNDTLFGELIGAPLPKAASDTASPSQIFDRALGLNRRKQVRDEIAQFSNTFTDAKLATSQDYAMAFVSVGYDSVLGSLGSSLVAVLKEAEGERLCDIAYPEDLPHTGVPYIERIAARDGAFQETAFARGDRFRLFLDAVPARGANRGDELYFGKGRHVCIGKELSQWLWRALVKELAKVSLKVSLIEVQLRRRDYVFCVYEGIVVSFHG